MTRPVVCRQRFPWISGLFDEQLACAVDEILQLDGHRIEHARADAMLTAEAVLRNCALPPWAAISA
jgi:hypothetical protein